jgi:hypothetical protein
VTRSALDFYSRPVDLVPGDETDDYEVTGRPFTQPDGQVRVQVAYFADPWRAGFVCGDADDVVPVVGVG